MTAGATHVATLVAPPGALREHHVAAARCALPDAEAPRWLAPGTAADIAFWPAGDGDTLSYDEVVRRTLEGAAVDVVVQPITGRRKRLLVADMDGTMIREECIDELAALAGEGEAVRALTRLSVRGEVDFAESLRRRAALLRGLPAAAIDVVAAKLMPMPGAATLVATMRQRAGALTVLASGGFTGFTAVVAARLGFARHHGNVLVLAEGRVTGGLGEPVLDPAGKAAILAAARDDAALPRAATLAVGDGSNDLPMLAEAGLGICRGGAPAVRAAAPARIDHCDLTALLFLQGYHYAEFVTAEEAHVC